MLAVVEAAHKVAGVQAASVAFNLERTLQNAEALAADAPAQSARLVLFPEAFLSAYPLGLGFGAVVGSRTYCHALNHEMDSE